MKTNNMENFIEACPECYDEDYTINDYGDSFDIDGGAQWWYCTCNKCGCRFTINRGYTLTEAYIEKEGE